MSKTTCLSVLMMLLFALLVTVGMASAEMRIFTLEHKPAAEIAELVRGLVSDGAKVATHHNTLVVNTTPAELEMIARLVADYDKPLSLLRVTVEQGRRQEMREQDLGASGWLQGGSIEFGIGQASRHTGSSLRFRNDTGSARLSAQDRARNEQRSAQQFMVVMEGSPASISVGKRVPFTSELHAYWRRHPHYVETVAYQNVDTGFEVLPTVQGGAVDLEISPFMAFLDSDHPNRIVFHDLTTRIRVPLGSWYDLGGHVSTQNDLSRAILRTGARSVQEENLIRVRIDPEG